MNAKPTYESRLLIVGEQQRWIEAEYRNNICIKHNSSLYDISQHDNKITWKIFSITGLFGGHISITITAGVFHFTFFCEVYVCATWCIVLYHYASFGIQYHFAAYRAHDVEFWADVSNKNVLNASHVRRFVEVTPCVGALRLHTDWCWYKLFLNLLAQPSARG